MAIPTLFNVASPILTKPEDQLGYLIMAMFQNPGFTSNFYSDMILSVRRMVAENSDNPKNVAAAIQTRLTAAFSRVVPENQFIIECMTEKVSGNKLKVLLAVKDLDDKYVLPSTLFELTDDGDLTFKAQNRL